MYAVAGVEAVDGSASLIASVILLLAAGFAVAAFVIQLLRRRQADARRVALSAANDDSRLSRSSSAPVNNPLTFGGGATTAAPTNRREAVTYGYLAVAEEYVSLDNGLAWSVLTVTLPGWAPYLVVDHHSAIGRPGVPPAEGQQVETGDPAFDSTFVVTAAEPEVLARVLTDPVRRLLEHYPLQRVSLSGRSLLLRTFDQNQLTDTVLEGLRLAASELLGTAPSFVMERRPALGPVASLLPATPDPLLQGFYGDEQSTG